MPSRTGAVSGKLRATGRTPAPANGPEATSPVSFDAYQMKLPAARTWCSRDSLSRVTEQRADRRASGASGTLVTHRGNSSSSGIAWQVSSSASASAAHLAAQSCPVDVGAVPPRGLAVASKAPSPESVMTLDRGVEIGRGHRSGEREAHLPEFANERAELVFEERPGNPQVVMFLVDVEESPVDIDFHSRRPAKWRPTKRRSAARRPQMGELEPTALLANVRGRTRPDQADRSGSAPCSRSRCGRAPHDPASHPTATAPRRFLSATSSFANTSEKVSCEGMPFGRFRKVRNHASFARPNRTARVQ